MLSAQIFILLVFFGSVAHLEAKFKSLHCNGIHKETGEFLKCKIKAVNRDKNLIDVWYRVLTQTNNISVRMEFLKRANGWRPFLYDIKINLCDFIANKKRNIIMDLAYAYLKPYLRFEHNCPAMINDIIKVTDFDFDLDNFRQRFPIETGEYGLRLSFYSYNVLEVTVNGSIMYSNYKEQ